MNKDKKYNIILGIMIFLFVILIGVVIAWGLGYIGIKSNQEEVNNKDSVAENTSDIKVENTSDIKTENTTDIKVENTTENKTENEDKKEQVISTIEETVLKEYIKKIYRRFEIGIPEFKNINDADARWLWGVIYNNCNHSSIDMIYYTDNTVVYKNDMISKGKELFGEALTVTPPVEPDIYFLEYNSKYDCYVTVGRGGEVIVPKYVISGISRKNDVFTVEIVEYLYDESEYPYDTANKPYKISLNSGKTKVVTFNSNENFDVEKYVLENKNKFVQKKLTIKNNSGKYNLVSSEIIK